MNGSKMYAGISVACCYPEYPEIALKKLCEKGAKRFEIFTSAHSETDPDFARSLADILKQNGAECVSLHPFTCGIDTYMLYTGYDRRVKDYIEYHKRYFDAMNILGAKYYVLHGCKDDLPDEKIVEGYRLLDLEARKFGVRVLQENVCRCTTGDLNRLVRMKQILGDEVGFVLDTKQAVRKNADPYDFIPALGKSIKHVHFSDHGTKGDCLLPGEGDIDTVKFISALKDIDFDGCVMLELYRRNYEAYDDLIKAAEYIQNVIDNT